MAYRILIFMIVLLSLFQSCIGHKDTVFTEDIAIYKPKDDVMFQGIYDNTARMHDALLCRFTTRDPLAEKHPEHSPYLFCGANPLRYIDPDGLDIHRYDEAGNYIETISNSEGVDTIQIGRYSDIGFVSVADQALSGNGVFKRLFETTLTDEDGTHNLSFMTIRGDEDAFNVFKLFADLTGVEWTLVQTGTPGKNGKNYLCTSRDKDANVATSLLTRVRDKKLPQKVESAA